MFNYDCSGEYITGEAAHRRTTCGNASNPCNIKGASVIGVRGQRVVVDGTSANRVKGEGFGQSRPAVVMSVLGGDSSQRRPRLCRSKPSILIGTQERPHRLHHARSFGERVVEIDQHHDAGLGGDAGSAMNPTATLMRIASSPSATRRRPGRRARGVVAPASYEARQFGVHSHEPGELAVYDDLLARFSTAIELPLRKPVRLAALKISMPRPGCGRRPQHRPGESAAN
jgi:hypothetical protein